MFLPSDSWYQFKPKVKFISKRELRINKMQTLWEELQMPVYNSKTGEEDFVDISLVNKIVIDSEYIENMISNKKVKIDITLTGEDKDNTVNIKAENNDLKLSHSCNISLQSFEEMLFKAIHENNNQRLEEVEEFKTIMSDLVNQLIKLAGEKEIYLVRLNEEHKHENGIGIIRDIKTNQDVGTFEYIEYEYTKKDRFSNIESIILSGRTYEDLKEKDRFEYAFYSLDKGLVYSIIAGHNAITEVDEKENSIDLQNYDLLIESFNSQHKYYKLIETAQNNKPLIEGIDESHPLYDTRHEEFRTTRLNILEKSKEKQKQEKLVSQFADIEIDF